MSNLDLSRKDLIILTNSVVKQGTVLFVEKPLLLGVVQNINKDGDIFIEHNEKYDKYKNDKERLNVTVEDERDKSKKLIIKLIKSIEFSYDKDAPLMLEKVNLTSSDFSMKQDEYNDFLKLLISNCKEQFLENEIVNKVLIELENMGNSYLENDKKFEQMKQDYKFMGIKNNELKDVVKGLLKKLETAVEMEYGKGSRDILIKLGYKF